MSPQREKRRIGAVSPNYNPPGWQWLQRDALPGIPFGSPYAVDSALASLAGAHYHVSDPFVDPHVGSRPGADSIASARLLLP
jgi:hypothetical protein